MSLENLSDVGIGDFLFNAWVANRKRENLPQTRDVFERIMSSPVPARSTEEEMEELRNEQMRKRADQAPAANSQLNLALMQMGVPKALMQRVVRDRGTCGKYLLDKRSAACVLQWMKRKCHPRVLVLAGEPGIGKTTASLIPLYHDAIRSTRDRQPKVFFPYGELAKACRAFNAQDRERVSALYTARTLVIDGINGAGGVTGDDFEQVKAFLAEMLDQRAGHGHATILTTNCSKEALSKIYGDQFASYLTSPRGTFQTLTLIVEPAVKAPSGTRFGGSYAKLHGPPVPLG